MIVTGFTTLGQVDLSEPTYDMECVTLVLWNNTTGGLALLTRAGCICCTDLWDDVSADEAMPFGTLAELADKLFTQVRDAAMDDDDRLASATEAQEVVKTVALLLATHGETPELNAS